MPVLWPTVTIVGVGLIGGSAGLALARRGLAERIVGVGRSTASLAVALDRGAVTEVTTDLNTAVAAADFVLVATRVGLIGSQLEQIDAAVRPGTLITDAGSTKESIVVAWEAARPSRRGRFVGSHPLAGSHQRGPQAADADLFSGRLAVLTPVAETPQNDVEAVRQFWNAIGAETAELTPTEHDKLLAAASHTPHLVAAALAAATPTAARPLTAGGWRDTTRVAAGDPELWTDILLDNAAAVAGQLDAVAAGIDQLRQAIAAGDREMLIRLLTLPRKAVMLWEVDVHLRQAADAGLSAIGRDLGLDLSNGHAATGWLIEGDLDRTTVERLATELLADPVTEVCRVAAATDPGLLAPPDQSDTAGLVLHVLPKPGVTDPAAESAREAMALLGIEASAVRSLKKYWLPAGINAAQAEELAWKRLASDAIHEVILGGLTLTSLTGGGRWHLVRETVPLDGLDDAALEAISRERCLALTADELRAVRDHFATLDRPPFEIELETIAQTWSEHCCHKTLGSPIDHQGPDGHARFDNLLKETVFAATQTVRERLGPDDWCVSVFRDNSGVVRFDGDHDICVKVETHNHPSAIEPYGGAATGLGGVIRDVLGTGHGAKPLANLDVFCVAPLDTPTEEIPPGVIPPPRLLEGVVAGVRDYGNRMGIPTIAGAVAFHPGYLGNPLVFCGTVGIMPRDSADGRVEPGDLVVVAGGRTGRDGIHGATFSSIELSSDSEAESGGSVQIGHAIHEKTVTDFVLAAAEEQLFHAITDCGAGGLSSAVGEMGAELGAEVDLDTVPLKYAGLSATEVWISEAQERMVLAVAPADWPRLAELARQEGTEATAIGRFTGDGRLVLRWEGETVGDLDCHFLHEGRPRRRLTSRYTPPAETELTWSLNGADLGGVLLDLLGTADVASKEWIIRQYDHEVQGQSVLKPLLGPAAGPADATVIRGTLGRPRGIVLGVGLRHHLGPIDPYQMAVGGIVEAVANCIAAGADPARIALLDNFCWGDCRRPESLGTLVEACLGCQDAAIALAAPFVSGKDSLNNVFTWTAADGQQQERSIPPTLLATALGQITDVGRCLSPDLKQPGNRLAIIGLSAADIAGSQLAVLGRVAGGRVPQVDLAGCRRVFATIHRLATQQLLRACHDLSDGGLAVAVAEMAIGSGLGAAIDLAAVPLAAAINPATADDLACLLTVAATETPGRFLCEVAEADAAAFAAVCADLPWAWLGHVTDDGQLTLKAAETVVADVPVAALDAAWRAPSRAHTGESC